MAGRAAKAALFDGLASVAKALGNGRRAEIVDVLTQGERSVEQIATEIEQTVANTSQHLQHLLRAGLVRPRRDGNRVHYALADAKVGELWASVRDVAAAQVADVERLAAEYLGDRSQLTTVSRAELTRRLGDGDVIVIDVRPRAEYEAGHIPGAVSMPLDNLAQHFGELPTDTVVVAYCRGPFCVYADDAVRALRRAGRRSARLEDGFPEWVRAGLPVNRGAGG
ncbi:ArsR/SmtB family transcription factor [Rhodococcus daqingensis]|uniref:ArsR/SmtB family transcription factor n=1 Tax=Rhodococcus daqingensis TaxID=2479363 RepID=A0ABW2S0I5_9NOCA